MVFLWALSMGPESGPQSIYQLYTIYERGAHERDPTRGPIGKPLDGNFGPLGVQGSHRGPSESTSIPFKGALKGWYTVDPLWVHVAIWYRLGPQSSSYVLTFGPI